MKQAAKAVLRFLGFLCALPWIIYCRVGRAVRVGDLTYAHAIQALAGVPGMMGNIIRSAFYHALLGSPLDLDIHYGSMITHRETRIGHRVWIGLYCVIGTADIGDDVLIASRVSILSGKNQHGISDPDLPYSRQPGTFESVTIAEGAWLGEGVVVMDHVGRRSIIGAGSVVTRAVEDGMIAVGNPARVVRPVIADTTDQVD